MNKHATPIDPYASAIDMEDVSHVGDINFRSRVVKPPHDVNKRMIIGEPNSENYFISNWHSRAPI